MHVEVRCLSGFLRYAKVLISVVQAPTKKWSPQASFSHPPSSAISSRGFPLDAQLGSMSSTAGSDHLRMVQTGGKRRWATKTCWDITRGSQQEPAVFLVEKYMFYTHKDSRFEPDIQGVYGKRMFLRRKTMDFDHRPGNKYQ